MKQRKTVGHSLTILLGLSTLMTILAWSELQAAQRAVVRVDRAYVYADTQRKSIIGYVRKGKEVQVGTISRGRETLLPVVISDKIAYMQIRDLYLGKELEALEQNYVVQNSVDWQPQTSGYSHECGVAIGQFQAGSDWANAVHYVGLQSSNPIGQTLQLRYGPLYDDTQYSYRFGANFDRVSETDFRYLNLSVAFDATYLAYEKRRHQIGFTIGGNIAPYSSMKILGTNMNGFSAGMTLGPEWRMRLVNGVRFRLGGGYRYQQLYGYPESTIINVSNLPLAGWNVEAGLSTMF